MGGQVPENRPMKKGRDYTRRREREMRSDFNVQLGEWDAVRQAAQRVREMVFVVEQGVPIELEWDDFDAVSDHALASDADRTPIGTGRLIPDGRIGRMAVLREFRGGGIGAEILAALLERARERGMTRIVLHAQTHAAPFYARFGFQVEGEPFMEAGIPHLMMARALGAAARP